MKKSMLALSLLLTQVACVDLTPPVPRSFEIRYTSAGLCSGGVKVTDTSRILTNVQKKVNGQIVTWPGLKDGVMVLDESALYVGQADERTLKLELQCLPGGTTVQQNASPPVLGLIVQEDATQASKLKITPITP